MRSIAGDAVASVPSTIRFNSADSEVSCARASATNRSLVSLDTRVIRCVLLLIVTMSVTHIAAAGISCKSIESADNYSTSAPVIVVDVPHTAARSI